MSEKIKKEKEEDDMYVWCLEQASDRYKGELSQDKIELLLKVDKNFFVFYEDELDKLGYDWERNNPNGIRWKNLIPRLNTAK